MRSRLTATVGVAVGNVRSSFKIRFATTAEVDTELLSFVDTKPSIV